MRSILEQTHLFLYPWEKKSAPAIADSDFVYKLRDDAEMLSGLLKNGSYLAVYRKAA